MHLRWLNYLLTLLTVVPVFSRDAHMKQQDLCNKCCYNCKGTLSKFNVQYGGLVELMVNALVRELREVRAVKQPSHVFSISR